MTTTTTIKPNYDEANICRILPLDLVRYYDRLRRQGKTVDDAISYICGVLAMQFNYKLRRKLLNLRRVQLDARPSFQATVLIASALVAAEADAAIAAAAKRRWE